MSSSDSTLSGIVARQARTTEFLQGLKDAQKQQHLQTLENVAAALAVGYGITAYQRYRNAKRGH